MVTSLGSASSNTDAQLILAVPAGLEIDNLSAPLSPSQTTTIRTVLKRLFLGLECLGNRADTARAREEPA